MSNERETELKDILLELNNDNNSYISLLPFPIYWKWFAINRKPKEINRVLIEYVLSKRKYYIIDNNTVELYYTDKTTILKFIEKDFYAIDDIDFINIFLLEELFNIYTHDYRRFYYDFYNYIEKYDTSCKILDKKYTVQWIFMCNHDLMHRNEDVCTDDCYDKYEFPDYGIEIPIYLDYYNSHKTELLNIIKKCDKYILHVE